MHTYCMSVRRSIGTVSINVTKQPIFIQFTQQQTSGRGCTLFTQKRMSILLPQTLWTFCGGLVLLIIIAVLFLDSPPSFSPSWIPFLPYGLHSVSLWAESVTAMNYFDLKFISQTIRPQQLILGTVPRLPTCTQTSSYSTAVFGTNHYCSRPHK